MDETALTRKAIKTQLKRAARAQVAYQRELGPLWLLIGGKFDERLDLSDPEVTVDYLLKNKKEL